MNFCPDRLIKIRTELGITKSEAARLLNMSAMGYGRYENGDRTPSYQTISFIAQKFGTSVEYLCGETSKKSCVDYLVTSDSPELHFIVETLQNESSDNLNLIVEYIKKLHS